MNGFKILIVDDERDFRETYRMVLTHKGYQVALAASAKEGLALLAQEYFPLVITDIMMPEVNGVDFLQRIKNTYENTVEVIMVTGYGSVETAVQTMKAGAFGYFIKSHDPEELLLEIEKVKLAAKLDSERMLRQGKNEGLFCSANSPMNKVWQLTEQVAATKANVLILGESGTGKEIVAKRLHQLSGRETMPFVPLNCQHYPESLIGSELFGHEKGAFTGAAERRAGKLEEASGGTVFLDEIGEMDAGTQVKLLRVLETRQLERIGSNKQIQVDFRLISATNQDLYQSVSAGRFRKDLLYRINTIEISLPPLRERREDILPLTELFLEQIALDMGKAVPVIEPTTRQFLLDYSYPGNVRELRNIIERLVILSPDGVLRINAKERESMQQHNPGEETVVKEEMTYRAAKQEFEKRYITQMLTRCEGNITRAAARMGLSRRQLFNKMTELNIGVKGAAEGEK